MTGIPPVVSPNTPKRMVGCDLLNLAAQKPAALVELSERQYRARIGAVADAILTSGRHIVMLTGPSAAGKTTSANNVARELRRRGVRSQVVSLDDFFVGEGRYPKQPDGSDDYECVEALDIPLVRRCLRQLVETGVCDAPVFDFLTQRPAAETQHIDCTGGVAVIEGLHAFNPVLTSQQPADAVLYVYAGLREEYTGPDGRRLLATRDIRLTRRIVRDWQFRGHDADFTIGLWPHVCSSEELYIKKFKNRADFLLDTSFSCEAGIWESYIRELTAGKNTARLAGLQKAFAEFAPISAELIPQDSMLREFIGRGGGAKESGCAGAGGLTRATNSNS